MYMKRISRRRRRRSAKGFSNAVKVFDPMSGWGFIVGNSQTQNIDVFVHRNLWRFTSQKKQHQLQHQQYVVINMSSMLYLQDILFGAPSYSLYIYNMILHLELDLMACASKHKLINVNYTSTALLERRSIIKLTVQLFCTLRTVEGGLGLQVETRALGSSTDSLRGSRTCVTSTWSVFCLVTKDGRRADLTPSKNAHRVDVDSATSFRYDSKRWHLPPCFSRCFVFRVRLRCLVSVRFPAVRFCS